MIIILNLRFCFYPVPCIADMMKNGVYKENDGYLVGMFPEVDRVNIIQSWSWNGRNSGTNPTHNP